MRKPDDVSRENFEDMLKRAPKGGVLVKSAVSKSPFLGKNFWRDFYFEITGEPSRESGLKRGQTLVLSCVRKIERKGLGPNDPI